MAENIRSNSDCGCCSGLDVETPRRIDNQSGRDTIGYRVGTHAWFKESLLARLSSANLPQLAQLSTRADSDFTIALADALATTLDVLSFYQERIANEHYLRTASERLSIQELARLIGYELAPGVAASTWLAFELQETPGSAAPAVEPVTLKKGVRVQSVPGQDEKAQTFETVESVEARVEWNGMRVQTSVPWLPEPGDTSLWLAGVGVGVQPGDAVLIVGTEREEDAGSERWDIRLVDTVIEDVEQERSRLCWQAGLGSTLPSVNPAASGVMVYVFKQRAALFGHNAPDPRLMGTTGGSQLSALITGSGAARKWNNYSIQDNQIDLDSAYPKILPDSWIALVSNEDWQSAGGLPGYVELYRVSRVSFPSRRDFGLSGRITRIIPDLPEGEETAENLDKFSGRLRETLVLAQSEPLTVVNRVLDCPLYGSVVPMAGLTPGIMPGRTLAVRGKRACIRLRRGQPEVSLSLDEGGTVTVAEGDVLRLTAPPEGYTAGSWEQVTPEAFGNSIGNDSARQLRLKVIEKGGSVGQVVVEANSIELVPALEDDPQVQEIVFISKLPEGVTDVDRLRSVYTLSKALQHCYDRESVRVNANVARATHGETVTEVLGSADARVANARFSLRQSPLTYVSATTPSGRASTLTLRVNDMQWREVDSLYGKGGSDRVFSLHQDDLGQSSVLFGDGVEGARPPSGDHNVRAEYRKGLGVDGNVGAGKLTTLLARPLGLAGATNPEAASGGEDPEQEEKARQNAPFTVKTLERAVSVLDYQDFARSFAGIAKAHALWIPNGPARGIFITVAGENGAPVPETSTTYSDLLEALHLYGDPLMPVRIASYRDARFELRMAVQVIADADEEIVLAGVNDELVSTFCFAARDFGQTVSLDEVVAAAHRVSGVEAVQVSRLQRTGGLTYSPHLPLLTLAQWTGFGGTVRAVFGQRLIFSSQQVKPRLFSALPVPSLTELPLAAELLLLDEDSLSLELMS